MALIYMFYQCGAFSNMNGFRLIRYSVIADLYKCVLLAPEEKKEFLNFIKGNKWASEMETIKNNTLKPSTMYKKVVEYQDDNQTVLVSLLEAHQRHLPSLINELQSLYSSGFSKIETEKNSSRSSKYDCDEQWCTGNLS